MSQDGLMGKFEALVRKHRGAEAATSQSVSAERQAPAEDAWLPVLTDVIQRGSPPPAEAVQAYPATTVTPRHEAAAAAERFELPKARPPLELPDSIEPSLDPATVLEVALPEGTVPEMATETQDAQITASLVDELTPKITGLMQEQVAEELRKSLNQSMANLMANLNANVEEMVRQAVAEKLAVKDKKSGDA